MNVVVVGANGQLGTDICRVFRDNGETVHGLTHADIEIGSESSTQRALSNRRPDLIINCAAMHHVDKCEADPDAAFMVNATGARNLAVYASREGAILAHISTDYVFDGAQQHPYVESDSARPLNAYGRSKLAGEDFIRTLAPRHFVVRVSSIYGAHPCRAKGGLNFVELMLKLAAERRSVRVVDDEFITPTPTIEIAKQLLILARTAAYGTYHASAEGQCSWFEFAKAIFDISGTTVRLDKAGPGEFPAKAPRPKYSVLENEALKRQGLNIFGHWSIGLGRYLESRVNPRAAIA